jgi:hypothetical protein
VAVGSSQLDNPTAIEFDSSGDMYITDMGNERVLEVPVSSGTQWGILMTADDIYTIAGSTIGAAGKSANGTADISSLLDGPSDVLFDHHRPSRHYDADGHVLSTREGNGPGHAITSRMTSYTYDPDGNQTNGHG